MKTRRAPAHIRRWVRSTVTPPVITDDAAHGYRVGDTIVVPGREWQCIDNTTGAAIWRPVNLITRRATRQSVYPQSGRKVLSIFELGAGVEWVQQAGDTVADDSTTYRRGNKSVKTISVSGTATSMDKTPGVAYDLSSYTHIYVAFYVVNAANANTTAQWLFFATTAWSAYYRYNLGTDIKNGWNIKVIPKADFSVAAGAPNWNSISKMRISSTGNTATGLTVTWDELAAYTTQLARGAVVLTFDDTFNSHLHNAARYMDKYAFPGVVYLNTNNVGNADQLTWAQARELQNLHNWEIGSHGSAHVDMTTITAAEVELNLAKSIADCVANGIEPPDSFANPSGGSNDTVTGVVQKFFATQRLASNTPNRTCWPIPNPWDLRCINMTNANPVATIRAAIDACETAKDVLIVLSHDWVAADPTAYQYLLADARTIIDYLATKSVDVLTLRQLMQRSV